MPYVNCDLFKQSFEYRVTRPWNFLPSHLRKAASLNAFKKLYKLKYIYIQPLLIPCFCVSLYSYDICVVYF